MELNNIPEAFQSKLRLMIISALLSGRQSFSSLKEITGATDGNLSAQINKLGEAGYIAVTKSFVGKKPLTACELTPLGRESFREYVEMLNAILSGE